MSDRTTALNITPEEMAQYRRAARRRWQQEQARRERAWQLARQAADLLRQKYGVERVVVFGSLTHPDRFSLHSDLDMAAWGLTAKNWLKAMGAVRYLSEEIEVNLVDAGCCSPELLAVIERDGAPV